MLIGDKYRFRMSVPTLGIVEVFPVNETLTWKHSKDRDVASFVKSLDTALIFVDDSTKFIGPLQPRQDFTYIYNVERSRDFCNRFQIFIDKRCEITDPFVPYWTGFFTTGDCTFDVEKCKVSVVMSVDDGTRCFLDNWDQEINLVEGAPDFIPDSQQTFGTIRQKDCSCENCFSAPRDSFPDLAAALTVTEDCEDVGGAGWTVLEHRGVFGGEANGNPWDVSTSWVRERVTSVGMPSDNNGNPWTEVSPDVWVRAPLLTLVFPYNVGYIDPLFPNTWQFLVRYKLTALSGDDVDAITNGRYLNTLLQFYFDNICNGYEIRSNFFGLNPDGTAPTNTAYANALIDLQELVLVPTHDIVKLDETERTFRISDWSLEDLIANLVNTFNLEFFYDYSVSAWRLEHITYLQNIAGLDLTTDESKKYLSGKWSYSYDKSDIPRRETFTFATLSEHIQDVRDDDKNFDGYQIDYYPSNCLSLDSGDEIRVIDIYLTNLFFIINDHKPIAGGATTQEDSQFYATTTMCLISTTNNKVNVGLSCLTVTDNALNIKVGWPCIHENYWRPGRPLRNGTMNRITTTFSKVTKLRQQIPITLDMCCLDYDTKFNPNSLTRTQLGDGELVEAVYEEPAERLTLTLKHA